jgi:hypothetical protein
MNRRDFLNTLIYGIGLLMLPACKPESPIKIFKVLDDPFFDQIFSIVKSHGFAGKVRFLEKINANSLNDTNIVSKIEASIKIDFQEDRIFLVNDWFLSETEVHLITLYGNWKSNTKSIRK